MAHEPTPNAYRVKLYGARGRRFVDTVLDHHPTLRELCDMADADGWYVAPYVRVWDNAVPGYLDRPARLVAMSPRTGKPYSHRRRTSLIIADWDNTRGYVPITYRVTPTKGTP